MGAPRPSHGQRPFALLLHGGDQIYADEVVDAHPLARAWADGRNPAADPAELAGLSGALLDAYAERYLALLAQPEIAHVAARIPSLAMWDDHDIVDGWGSLRPERLDSPVGRTLFAAARAAFLVFQLGEAPDRVPPIGLDPSGPACRSACGSRASTSSRRISAPSAGRTG